MKDIDNWQTKFAPCYYSNRLLDKLIQLNTEVIRPVDINEITQAIYYAKKYHGKQMRKSGEPYYSHPLEVAYMISDYLFRTDIIVSSILHDVIEDTELTKAMIAKIFGHVVAMQVEDLTRVKLDRKISAIEMIQSLWYQKKYDILLIKLLDRFHNMQTLKFQSSKQVRKIVAEYFQSFITLSRYFSNKIPKMLQIEEEMYRLCYQNLSI